MSGGQWAVARAAEQCKPVPRHGGMKNGKGPAAWKKSPCSSDVPSTASAHAHSKNLLLDSLSGAHAWSRTRRLARHASAARAGQEQAIQAEIHTHLERATVSSSSRSTSSSSANRFQPSAGYTAKAEKAHEGNAARSPAYITTRIKGTSCWRELLDTLQAFRPHLNALHASAATTHAAQLLQGAEQQQQLQRQLHPSQLPQQQQQQQQHPSPLSQQQQQEQQQQQPGEGHTPNALLMSLLLELQWEHAGCFAARQAANSLWALAKLQQVAQSEGMAAVPFPLLHRLMARLEACMLSAQPQELANAMWALATLRLRPSPSWLHAWCTACDARWHLFKPQELSTLLWGCGCLGWRGTSPAWLQRALHAHQPLLSRCESQELVMGLWGLAQALQQQQQQQRQQQCVTKAGIEAGHSSSSSSSSNRSSSSRSRSSSDNVKRARSQAGGSHGASAAALATPSPSHPHPTAPTPPPPSLQQVVLAACNGSWGAAFAASAQPQLTRFSGAELAMLLSSLAILRSPPAAAMLDAAALEGRKEGQGHKALQTYEAPAKDPPTLPHQGDFPPTAPSSSPITTHATLYPPSVRSAPRGTDKTTPTRLKPAQAYFSEHSGSKSPSIRDGGTRYEDSCTHWLPRSDTGLQGWHSSSSTSRADTLPCRLLKGSPLLSLALPALHATEQAACSSLSTACSPASTANSPSLTACLAPSTASPRASSDQQSAAQAASSPPSTASSPPSRSSSSPSAANSPTLTASSPPSTASPWASSAPPQTAPPRSPASSGSNQTSLIATSRGSKHTDGQPLSFITSLPQQQQQQQQQRRQEYYSEFSWAHPPTLTNTHNHTLPPPPPHTYTHKGPVSFLGPREACSLLRSAAGLHLRPGVTARAWVASMVERAVGDRDCRAHDLVDALVGAARLDPGLLSPPTLTRLWHAAEAHHPMLDPHGLVLCAWALARLRVVPSGKLLAAVQRETDGLLQQQQQQHLHSAEHQHHAHHHRQQHLHNVEQQQQQQQQQLRAQMPGSDPSLPPQPSSPFFQPPPTWGTSSLHRSAASASGAAASTPTSSSSSSSSTFCVEEGPLTPHPPHPNILTPPEVAAVCWAFGALRVRPDRLWLVHLLGSLWRNVHLYRNDELAQVVLALGRMRCRPSEEWSEWLATELQGRISVDTPPLQVVQMVHAVAACMPDSGPLEDCVLTAAGEVLLPHIQDLGPTELTSLVWACARMGRDVDEDYAFPSAHAPGTVLPSRHGRNDGSGAGSESDEGAGNQGFRLGAVDGTEGDGEGAAGMEGTAALDGTAGLEGTEGGGEGTEGAGGGAAAAAEEGDSGGSDGEDDKAGVHAQEGVMLWHSGHRLRLSRPAAAALTRACDACLDDLDAQQFSMLLISLPRLGMWLPEEWLGRRTFSRPHELRTLSNQDLCTQLYVCGKLHIMPPAPWLTQALHEVRQRTGGLNGHMVSGVLQGLSSLAFSPGEDWLHAVVLASGPALARLQAKKLTKAYAAAVDLEPALALLWGHNFESLFSMQQRQWRQLQRIP